MRRNRDGDSNTNRDPAGLAPVRSHLLQLLVVHFVKRLGTRGLGQVKGVLMGSVSRKVTNLSDISCMIIR